MKRRILWIVLVLLLAGGLTGGYFYAQGVGGKPPFRTAPVTRGPVTAAVSATGTLNAVITVLVGSQVSGQVKELYADFNSQVKKGQVIARIDPEIFEAKVNQAKAQVDAAKAAVLNQQASVERARADLGNARAAQAVARAQTAKGQVSVVDTQRDLGRKRDLRIKGFIAQADEDAAQAVYDSSMAQHDANKAQEQAQEAGVRSAEAALKVTEAQLLSAIAQVGQNEAGLRQTQLDLEHTIIRAPVDGVVVSRTVDVGQTVAASLQAPTLFTIAQDLTKMQVDTNVDEADVSRVKVGLRASFTVDSFPGQLFTGEIVQIRKAPQIVQNVVTYDVVVSAQNTDQKLLPGMTANVRIVTERKEDALRVPNAALRFRPAGGRGRSDTAVGRWPWRRWARGRRTRRRPGCARVGPRGRARPPRAGLHRRRRRQARGGPDPPRHHGRHQYRGRGRAAQGQAGGHRGRDDQPAPGDGPARPQALVMAPALIEAEGIVKDYTLGTRKVHALRGVSVLIASGEFVAVMGPSGSGKSTFMNLLGCLDTPSAGRYVLDGADVSNLGTDALARIRNEKIGFVFQTFNLLPRTTALENIELPLLYSGVPAKERAPRSRAKLDAVGLADRGDHHPAQLSGGQQQRVAIARALINNPVLILADEPTGALDSRTSVEIMALFQDLNRTGITIVLVTHEPDVARYAGRNLTFRDGRLIKDEAVAEPSDARQILATLPPEEEEDAA